MADIVRSAGQGIPSDIRFRYQDMGDGTHALVSATKTTAADSSTQALLINSAGDAVVVDSATNALTVIDYSHHEIHAGSHFIVADVVDQAINEVYDIQFTTPNTTRWIHFTFMLSAESETEWYIYEGATIVTPGTAVTPLNNNRNSTRVSGATVAGISNANLAAANADTPVAAALQLEHGIIGAGRSGGSDSRESELILKQNTVYCMRAIANAAGYIDFIMQWYEHTNAA